MDLIAQAESIVAEVRLEFAPDPRLAVYEVTVGDDGDALVLVGVTSEPAAAEALHRRVALLRGDRPVRDEVVRLPALPPGSHSQAVVTAAIAPMLAGPLVSESHVSQTVLGHRVTVLREHGRWLQCRSSDDYLGWVHRGYVRRVDDLEARRWETGINGTVCISLGAQVMAGDDVLAQLPWGARVVRLDEHTVELPTGGRGRLDGTIVPISELGTRFPVDGEAVVETARRWIGAPYMWSGITPAGVDCSGLVQAVFRTHGIELPRDSDMQARCGEPVDPGDDFSGLRPGDLLFFAEEPSRVSHVAISRGGAAILHSSLGNGGVRRNDLDGERGYEMELRRLFVCARRVLPG